jgi:hypothetical protein
MHEDPVVAEVRRIRETLESRCGFNTGAVFEELYKQQTALGSRLVRREQRQNTEPAAAADPARRGR